MPEPVEEWPTVSVPQCEHKEFAANVAINCLEDSRTWMADIRIHCVQCKTEFHFVGVDPGTSYRRPLTSADGLELRAPIMPGARALPVNTPIVFELHPEAVRAAEEEMDREDLPDHAKPEEDDAK